VLNSLRDIASCLLGLLVVGRLPVRYFVALFLVIALALLFVYRDNLLLNVIMLVFPSGPSRHGGRDVEGAEVAEPEPCLSDDLTKASKAP
jgi:hypothetical protein